MVDKLDEISRLMTEIDECKRHIANHQKDLATLRREQTFECAKKFKPILKNLKRYTISGLEEQLKEICKYSFIETRTNSSFYDSEETFSLKCSRCSMYLPLEK